MALEKIPEPVPSVVLASATVGPVVVLQQTPLAVTFPPPLSVIFPPDEAVVKVTDKTSVVVNVGTKGGLVMNDILLPYAMPAGLMAYALTL
jgi:hypothetical protein